MYICLTSLWVRERDHRSFCCGVMAALLLAMLDNDFIIFSLILYHSFRASFFLSGSACARDLNKNNSAKLEGI